VLTWLSARPVALVNFSNGAVMQRTQGARISTTTGDRGVGNAMTHTEKPIFYVLWAAAAVVFLLRSVSPRSAGLVKCVEHEGRASATALSVVPACVQVLGSRLRGKAVTTL
jgi:hypothetical protein